MEAIIISACTDAGVHIDGASLGAYKLGKYLENKYNVTYINNTSNFIKDKNPKNLQKNLSEINIFNNKLYHTIINSPKFPFTIGGDHSISIGSALASNYKNGNIGIIWFDAHPDYNTFNTTITGNIHGLPLATINGFNNKELINFKIKDYINPKNTVIVGARSIDELEKENLKQAGIKVFTTNDIKKLGIKYVINEALKIALNNTSKIHISYDLDVIDPNIAPGVSVPEKNGLTKKEALIALNLFLEKIDNIASFDLVEFNPLKDINNKTYDISTTILDTLLDKINLK